MPKTKLKWSARAKADLGEIGNYIAQDNRRAARKFISRLRASVRRLRDSPEGGSVVEEAGIPDIREIVFGNYRIIYRYDGLAVVILTVRHGARLFRVDFLEDD
ncbi:MAG: type II toxin-antitoxin system RelE/ParE family toxin [Gemmataceae bacterium]|nr:type II toxin-antitoxin system RelE/ParE family toxin [Gemmataceae bacterium]